MTRTARAGPRLEAESFLLGLWEHDLVLGMGPEGRQEGENPQALEKQTIMPTESGLHAGLVTPVADRQMDRHASLLPLAVSLARTTATSHGVMIRL